MNVRANAVSSIRAKLLNKSREQKADFGRILISYGLERLLYRLSVSGYRDEFVLKGAMLFTCWSGDVHRATRDVDFLKSGDASVVYLTQVFTDLCEQTIDTEDGLIFDASTIKAAEIREDDNYGGIRVTMKATLAKAVIPIQADIGIGDAVTPSPEDIEFPSLLGMPTPALKAYPIETVIAEKFEAMVSIGFANSRMKDFYDIWTIQKFMNPNVEILSMAIANTFQRRGTALPKETPIALSAEFSKDENKQRQWLAFVSRTGVSHKALKTLNSTVEDIRPLLMASVISLR